MADVVDHLKIFAAAFFRSKGKGVVTENEFLMDVSMNRRWMPYGDAERVLKEMISNGSVSKDGEYIRPGFDVSGVDVPVGYRPPADLSEMFLKEDVFQTLLSRSSEIGIDKKEFLAMCRTLQKKMNIEVEAAALIVLRDHGASISVFADDVYSAVSKR